MHPLSHPTVRPSLVALVSGASAVRIAVNSTLSTMKGEKEEELIISGSKGKYVADGKTVEATAIDALFRALDEPRAQ